MRFFTIIFTAYIFALSFAPCGDDVDCSKHIANKTEQTGNKHDHKTESCSPFCICACCSHISNFFSHKIEAYKYTLTFTAPILISSNETFISELHTNIWQPPKLSV